MSEAETYLTKVQPDVDDWLEFNAPFFAKLRGVEQEGPVQFAPFTDVDVHAERAGVSLEEYFAQIKQKVGPLGRLTLTLVYSPMDEACHVVVGPKEDAQDPQV